MTSEDYTRNHRVPQFTGTLLLMPQRHEIASLLRGDCIKSSNPSLDLVDKGLFERLHQYRAALPEGQNLQSEPNLEDRNGGRPDGRSWLFVEPIHYLLIR